MADDLETTIGGAARDFPRTTLGLLDGLLRPAGRESFEELCRRYWKPVYSLIRVGWRKSNDDAKDLTQQFFTWLFEAGVLRRYDSGRASFRTFVKALVRGFLADHHKALRREKRGGTARVLSLGRDDAPLERFLAAAEDGDPDRVFDQAWWMALVTHAVERVRERFAGRGRLDRFRVFDAYDLADGPEAPSYRDVGTRLGLSESAVRDALHAVRREIREEIRAELLRQTCSPEDFEEEWHALLDA